MFPLLFIGKIGLINMANSTYLQLVNKVLVLMNEVQLSESNFDDAIGIYQAVKNAVNSSINDINSAEYEWPFNFTQTFQTLTVGQVLYSLPADVKVVDWESFYVNNDGTLNLSTRNLERINKEEWEKKYKEKDFDNTTSGIGLPDFVFPYGSNQFGISQASDQAYTVKYNYYKVPTQLSAATDTTDIPDTWDYVIVAGALWYGNLFKSDENTADRIEKKYITARDNMRSILINRPENVNSNMIIKTYSNGAPSVKTY